MDKETDITEFSVKEKELIPNQLFSLIGSGLIFLGMFRLVVFYDRFNVDIEDYLDFSEIITSFFVNIIISVISIFYILLFIIPFIKTKNQFAFLKDRKVIRLLFILFLSGLLVSAILNYYYSNWTYSDFFISDVFYIASLLLSYYYYRQIHNIKLLPQKMQFLLKLGFVMFFLMLFITGSTRREISYILKKKNITQTQILFNDQTTFRSDSFSRYIGKTNKFVFIYYTKNDSTVVIPFSEIKKISFFKNKK